MIYKFKTGNLFRGIDAQTAGEELERIRLANDGKLATEDVLAKARPARSPIHNAFTWDDKLAAHQHRLWEARQFIRTVVVLETEDDTPRPAYWNVTVTTNLNDESERYYQSSAVIVSKPEEYQSALNLMLSKIASAQAGLDNLRSLVPKRDRTKVDRAAQHIESAKKTLTEIAP